LQHTVPYTPHQNGVVERKNKSLKEMTSCMWHARSLPSKLWVEALNCVAYIRNRAPHRSIEDMTPFEAWTSDKPNVTHFRIFGSRAWAHIPSENRKALDPKSTLCIFVGYPYDVKGYRLIDPSTNRLIIECNVQFEESHLHAPPVQHANTLVLPSVPKIIDDDSIQSDATYSDSEDFVHGDEQVVQLDEEPVSELQEMPKWAQSTLQAASNLAGNLLDSRTLCQHEEPAPILSTFEPVMPMHCYMVQSSDPQIYSEVAENPLWKAVM
jgi:hypothetical protein